MAKKGIGKRVSRPAGVSGCFKVVDPRMKKDLQNEIQKTNQVKRKANINDYDIMHKCDWACENRAYLHTNCLIFQPSFYYYFKHTNAIHLKLLGLIQKSIRKFIKVTDIIYQL